MNIAWLFAKALINVHVARLVLEMTVQSHCISLLGPSDFWENNYNQARVIESHIKRSVCPNSS